MTNYVFNNKAEIYLEEAAMERCKGDRSDKVSKALTLLAQYSGTFFDLNIDQINLSPGANGGLTIELTKKGKKNDKSTLYE